MVGEIAHARLLSRWGYSERMVLRHWALDVVAPGEAVREALHQAVGDPASLTDSGWETLLGASGEALDELCALADATRRHVIGDDSLTFVVNRNLDTAVITRLPAGGPSLADLVAEAAELGATEICMQGPVPDDAPADECLRLIARIHDAAPGMHLHALRPPEVRAAADRMGVSIAGFLRAARDAGLGSIPGTAAQILDDDVRAALSAGQAPPARDWIEVIETAHDVGLFSTATIVHGHLETPAQQVAHLRTLCEIQSRTQGFTELIVMPMTPAMAGAHVASPATGTASPRETRALHAVARLMTAGLIDHHQVAWTKLGADVVDDVLRGGVDDIGGLLLDGELMPAAGQEAGRVLAVDDLADIAARSDRVLRQRTTDYGSPTADRLMRIPQVRS